MDQMPALNKGGRYSSGKKKKEIFDFDEQSVVWNDFWSNKKAVSSFPRTPQTAGDYTLEIYVNGKLLTSMTFTVKA